MKKVIMVVLILASAHLVCAQKATRTHQVSWDFNQLNQDIEEISTEYTSLRVSYFYTPELIPRLSAGAGYAATRIAVEGEKTEYSAFQIMTRINFIENKSGERFVPFAKLSYLLATSQNDVASFDIDGDGEGYAFAVGCEFFPVYETLSMLLEYGATTIKYNLQGDTSSANFSNLIVGFGFYF